MDVRGGLHLRNYYSQDVSKIATGQSQTLAGVDVFSRVACVPPPSRFNVTNCYFKIIN